MNLKADLDQYLSQNKRTPGGGSVFEKFKLPSLSSVSSKPDPDTELLIEPERESWIASQLPTLNKKQRILGFGGCLSMGILCFFLAALYFPVLLLQTRKFALLFSLGNL
eukprot:TRINITY_DN1269_c0_g1_i2.p1 TRINITY_DN1269_c0_g1~~TRINITY_DN1269_c0_g1_i2.p1  ORF type:complete len:109 (-),score=20.68 TRINITY_DN1269_c0_g1_i2:153-479(-)